MRIVITGLLGQYAFGGVTWDYIQYLLGFRALGHDVWYLEDSGTWPYDPVRETIGADCTYNVAYLQAMMAEFGLGDPLDLPQRCGWQVPRRGRGGGARADQER